MNENKFTDKNTRRTHVANIDRDFTTGRKIINHYEVIEEIGRGVHGKVKLARDLDIGQNVAIKIVPRFSRKRRLGRITQNVSPFEKSKREIAILKKIRHPNVVALLEVIDDPDYRKIYLCLEHVECGEVIWRKKGLPNICAFERRRIEREMRGETLTEEEEQHLLDLERRFNVKEMKRAHLAEKTGTHADPWSLELGQDESELRSGPSEADLTQHASASRRSHSPASRGSAPSSQAPSRTQSVRSMSAIASEGPTSNEDDMETPGPLHSNPGSSSALAGTMYGAYDDLGFRERSPSMADSIISHMSSIDFNPQPHDPFADDFSYVPCFTIDEARNAFRDVVLGLEYLHYQGIVHRDIKPANLLWTRDHRVKISDFGVSYFGRPMRDGEPDDTVSESEAQDFDDEYELSKTVGTPAFFAPELCYTDLDNTPPPKVTEQIDVWSLGVTLYCMIFARIPFLAEDEFQMFRKIATEKVYIPTRRLRPVDPSTSPDTSSLYKRVNSAPYRDDHQLLYEDVDESLQHLLGQMLIKDPRQRITLRGVKYHPWVLSNLPNIMGWIDDTDPQRQTQGTKIKVNEKEVDDAVVPLTLLERARSTLKKTLTKLTSRSVERAEGASRRRATSSAASSAGDSPAHTPITNHLRDSRRKSLRGDGDYFATVREHSHTHSEHPLTYSVTASPEEDPPSETAPTPQQPGAVGGHPSHQLPEIATNFNGREDITDHQTPTSAQMEFPRHRHSRSISNAVISLHNDLAEARTAPTTPAVEDPSDAPSGLRRKGRGTKPSDDSTRSQSVDRALVFSSPDKRAEARVGVSSFIAPGSLEQPKKLSQMRSLDLGRAFGESPLPSPQFFSPHTISSYQYGQHRSDPMLDKFRTVVKIEERPMTAHRVQDIPEGKTPPPRYYGSSTPESFARAQETLRRRERLAHEEEARRQEVLQPAAELDAAHFPCPPSPDDDDYASNGAPSRGETFSTTFSSKSNSREAIATPWTSPSVVTSPVSYTTSASQKDLRETDADQILAFQSDPSLPALLSGASSVSADPEGDFLGNPGNPKTVSRRAVLETTDSVTPPALAKEPVTGFPLEATELDDRSGTVFVDDHEPDSVGNSTPTPPARLEDDDSDSDDGLLMMGHRSKKSVATKGSPNSMGKIVFGSKRRNTNASVGSTDTAKKVFAPGE